MGTCALAMINNVWGVGKGPRLGVRIPGLSQSMTGWNLRNFEWHLTMMMHISNISCTVIPVGPKMMVLVIFMHANIQHTHQMCTHHIMCSSCWFQSLEPDMCTQGIDDEICTSLDWITVYTFWWKPTAKLEKWMSSCPGWREHDQVNLSKDKHPCWKRSKQFDVQWKEKEAFRADKSWVSRPSLQVLCGIQMITKYDIRRHETHRVWHGRIILMHKKERLHLQCITLLKINITSWLGRDCCFCQIECIQMACCYNQTGGCTASYCRQYWSKVPSQPCFRYIRSKLMHQSDPSA